MFVLLASAVVHLLLLVGLGWGLVARLRLDPAERLLASAVISGLLLYAIAFGVYLSGAPAIVCRLLPLVGAVSLGCRRKELVELLGDWQARALLSGLGFVAVGCVALDWTIPVYSNGVWIADFWEHWLRACFWMDHWPKDTKFLTIYSETARPPLVNLQTAVLLQATAPLYALYQLEMTLAGVITVLPAGLLARRWGGPKAIPVLVLLLLVGPVFLAHAQFSWTKLPTVFWILSALYFFLRSRDADSTGLEVALAGLSMGAAIVAHYSALPYAIALTLAWLVDAWRDPLAAKRSWPGFLWALVPLAPWFLWAVGTYGIAGTFLTNTTVTTAPPTAAEHVRLIVVNTINTLVPRFWWNRELAEYLVQATRLGYFKDRWFVLFTSNFLVSIGITGWIVVAVRLGVLARASATRVFWAVFIAMSFLLCVAANSNPLAGGTAHVTLLALTILGVSFLASQWRQLPGVLKLLAWIGVVIDVCLGVILPTLFQSGAIEHRTHPEGRSMATWVFGSAAAAGDNFSLLKAPGVMFVATLAPVNGWILGAILASVLALAIVWCRRLLKDPAA